MTLTREKIESLAPDQASLAAALKLVKPASWPILAAAADGSLLWGECQGSGSTPFRVVASPGADAMPADGKAIARAEAQRLRLKTGREAAVAIGLDELDRWVLDL